MKRFFLLLATYCLLIAAVTGCSPTYPKEQFKESIIKVCRDEYKIDVKVDASGKTIAIYLPLQDLLDFTFSISKGAAEKINNVILSVSRVALSTDAKFDFYCVIAHDTRIPEIQIVIIKSVDDVKRFLLNDISRSEYSKRMLVDMRLNPQAQKERAIKEVFEKMSLDRKWQEEVMNDFFRSAPASLGDIGYWNSRFYVKDIAMPEFLADQVASRIKIEFREDKNLMAEFNVKIAKGLYHPGREKQYFSFEILAEPKLLKEFTSEEVPLKVFQTASKVAAGVLHGYTFNDFDYIEIINQSDGRHLKVTKDELEKLRTKKIKIDDIIKESYYGADNGK